MVIHYKCPNCGDDMNYDAKSGALSCPACGREDHIDSFPQDHIQGTFTDDEANEYHCENCGAVLITDKDTAATKCSYCGAGASWPTAFPVRWHPNSSFPLPSARKRRWRLLKNGRENAC